MFQINTKPLSQNQAWKGKVYKSKAYKDYEQIIKVHLMTFKLPRIRPNTPFYLFLEFGTPRYQDCSNSIKLAEDIICRHLGVNDNYVMAIFSRKVITKKQDSYIRFNIFEQQSDFLKTIIEETPSQKSLQEV